MTSVWQLPDHLAEFARNGGEELLNDILGIFLDDTPLCMSRLADAAGRGDLAAVFHEAHSLKGGALQIGADSLAGLAETLESGVPADRWPPLVEQINQEFDVVSAQIRVRIGRP